MKKTKIALVIVLVLTLVCPFSAFGATNSTQINVLKFDQVEKEIMARCQTVLNNSSDYGDLVFLNDIGQLSDKDLFKKGVSTEMANYLIVWSAENMYITYNTLSQQIEDKLAKQVLLEKKLRATKLQEELGMATAYSVAEAEKQLQEVELGIRQLQEKRDSIKEELNTMLGQEYDTPMLISDVPKVSSDTIKSINVDKDFMEGLKLAFKVKLQDKEQGKEDEKRKFKKSFYRAYQTILVKQKALEVEKKKFEVASNNHKIALLKYKLGLLSPLAYQEQYSSYVTSKVALQTAEDALFKAYREYQWAKRGLIVSTDSSSSSSASSESTSSEMTSI